jgi:outer membrane protein TolC
MNLRIASLMLTAGMLLSVLGCSTNFYRERADKDVYGILKYKEKGLFGKTNEFSIDTEYSSRDPSEIPPEELINGRGLSGEKRTIDIPESLRLAIANNRSFQSRKERLYLSALTLTGRRFEFEKQPFGRLRGGGDRESDKDLRLDSNGNRFGFTQLLKTGGTVSATLANDMVRYFTGDPRRSITTVMSVNFMQPLLRGAGQAIVAENLTQSERDVIYEIRDFALFQQTFAVGVISQYVRLLQQQDQVRNSYQNYLRLKALNKRAVAMVEAERMPKFQFDQSVQQDLSGRSSYISAVQRYQNQLDDFKKELNFPQGVHLVLNTEILSDLKAIGLQVVNVGDVDGYRSAVEKKLDILNAIDRFEDRKRKIKVAANALKAELNFLSDVSLQNDSTDYAAFDPGNFKASAGLELDLPFNRRAQRNSYRGALIRFESELRSLTISLDDTRDAVREGLRSLEQLRQNFVIQKEALRLANDRVSSVRELIEAGRAQIRDELEAQNALLSAQNSVTRVLVDYFDARLKFLIDVGVLNMAPEQWWLHTEKLVRTENTGPVTGLPDSKVYTPDEVFSGLANLN